jgi:hypothetical protein
LQTSLRQQQHQDFLKENDGLARGSGKSGGDVGGKRQGKKKHTL